MPIVDLLNVTGVVASAALAALAFVAGRDMRHRGAPMLAGISTCLLVLFLPLLGIPLWLLARRRLAHDMSAATSS
jgi:hypothetical protein